MDGFDHILNWKLKAGSHPFPGRNGGQGQHGNGRARQESIRAKVLQAVGEVGEGARSSSSPAADTTRAGEPSRSRV